MTINYICLAVTIITAIIFSYTYIKEKTFPKILIPVVLTLSAAVNLYLNNGMQQYAMIFYTGIIITLLGMAISDIEKMEVSTWMMFSLPIFTALYCTVGSGFYGSYIQIGAFFIGLVLLSWCYGWMLGGADILMITVMSAIMSYMDILYIMLGASVGLIVYYLIMQKKDKINKEMPMPFLPTLVLAMFIVKSIILFI